jgi:hypothetical protein
MIEHAPTAAAVMLMAVMAAEAAPETAMHAAIAMMAEMLGHMVQKTSVKHKKLRYYEIYRNQDISR